MGRTLTLESMNGDQVTFDLDDLDSQLDILTGGAVRLAGNLEPPGPSPKPDPVVVNYRALVSIKTPEQSAYGKVTTAHMSRDEDVTLVIPPTESTVELDLAALVRPLLLDLLGQVVLKVPPVSLVGSVPTDGSMAECCAEYKFKPVYLTSKAMDVPLGMVAMVGADGQVVVGGDHAAMDPDEPDTPPK